MMQCMSHGPWLCRACTAWRRDLHARGRSTPPIGHTETLHPSEARCDSRLETLAGFRSFRALRCFEFLDPSRDSGPIQGLILRGGSEECAQVVSLPFSRVKGGRSGTVAPRPRILHPRRGSTAHSRGDCLRRGACAQAMPRMLYGPPHEARGAKSRHLRRGGVDASTRERGTPVYYSADEVGTPPCLGWS